MYTYIQGAATSRNGSRYVQSTKYSNRIAVQFKFEFSRAQSYILEVGHEYIRFFTEQGPIESGGSPYEIMTPYTEDMLRSIRVSGYRDVLYMAHQDIPLQKLSRLGETEWTLEPVDFLNGPFTENPNTGSGVELVGNGAFSSGNIAPWVDKSTGSSSVFFTTGDMQINGAGSGISIAELEVEVEDDTATHQLRFSLDAGDVRLRVGTTSGGQEILAETTYTSTGNKTLDLDPAGNTTLYLQFRNPAGTTGRVDNISLKSKEKKLILYNGVNWDRGEVVDMHSIGFAPFSADSVGQLYFLQEDNPADTEDTTVVKVVTFIDSSNVEVTIVQGAENEDGKVPGGLRGTGIADSSAMTSIWKEGAFSAANGYPGVVAFFESRLFVGATTTRPQSIWGSKSGDYENFGLDEGQEIVATSTFEYEATTNDSVRILWLIDNGEVLLAGTTNGVLSIRATTIGEAITPTNVSIRRQNNIPCANIQPLLVNDDIFFVQEGGRKLLVINRNSEFDRYNARDITLLAEHITGTGIVDMTYMVSPIPMIWCTLADGTMAFLTYDQQQEVAGWHRHSISGFVESLQAVPTESGTFSDELWMTVRRTINGATVRYQEFIQFQDIRTTDRTDWFYVDSGLSYSGVAVSTISGLDHLEGEEVVVWANGAEHPNRTVSGGSITLNRSDATKVQVGISYTPRLRTLRPDLDSGGKGLGKQKALHNFSVLFYNSLGGQYATYNQDTGLSPFYDLKLRTTTDDPSDSPGLFSGIKRFIAPGGYGTEAQLELRQNLPCPFTVVALNLTYSINDG